ncbi:MAG: carbon starvation protein A [Kiritimatiellia bacterium]
MTALLVLVASSAVLGVAGFFYSRFLAKSWGEDPKRIAPAVELNDGRDYVPTPTPVVFAHHFASIAGAGPIVGPVLALCFGWGPAILWVVIGGLLIGGVHDYLAAFMSIRNRGQSVAMIARRLLGRGPFLAFICFLIIMLGLVTAVFLNTSATALVSMIDMGRMQLPSDQTLFRVADVAGQQKVIIGGVASMSVIVITIMAPLLGWLYIKKQVAVWKCSVLAIAICTVSIVVGLYHPVTLTPTAWKFTLAAYTLIAAGVPVWMFLQSRDFINVHILYAGIIGLFFALIVAAIRGGTPPAEAAIPVMDTMTGTAKLGGLWPALFITIACGAVSGFHSLCAGGTTCKQLKTEAATRQIGYWGMILESLLAAIVIITLLVGTTHAFYLEDVFPAGKDNNPVLGFAFAVGRVGHAGFGLPIAAGALAGMLLLEGFVITTLDTAIRLNRYLIEELWLEFFGRYDVFAGRASCIHAGSKEINEISGGDGIPSSIELPDEKQRAPIPTRGTFRGLLLILRQYWVNSGLAIALMLWLAFSGGILQLWKIFATSNQLLATFVLAIGSVWLIRNGKRVWYVLAPAIFMLATTGASLILLLQKFLPGHAADGAATGNATLFIADIVLLVLTAYLLVAGIMEICWALRQKKAAMAG